MNIEMRTALFAFGGMLLATALAVAGVGSAQPPTPAAAGCSLKDGRGCTDHDPQVVALQAKANQAIARINANPQAQTALHAALAHGDKAGAARILQENGLSEGAQFPITYKVNPERHNRQAAGHGTTATSTPAKCGYYYYMRMIIWFHGIDWEVVETYECDTWY